MDKIRVAILYPADPAGTIPGGIDTFIRGILRWAPPDITFSLVGISTDPGARPASRWSNCRLGRASFEFFPVILVKNPGLRSLVPLSLRYSLSLAIKNIVQRVTHGFDVLEFHRVEPSVLFFFDSRPKNIFVHQNAGVLFNKSSDIRWKHMPRLFRWLEDCLLPRMNTIFAVSEDATLAYKQRYPRVAERIRFIPTWVDPDVYHPISEGDRQELKPKLAATYGFDIKETVVISVGRLDYSKDPLLLLEAFAGAVGCLGRAHLIFVGDGVLRDAMAERVTQLGLSRNVSLVGLRSPSEVADMLRISGIFVLSSAYECMPMCVLEALGSGVPVAATDVGEIRRIVKPGINGEIAKERSADALGEAIVSCYNNLDRYSGVPCLESVAQYVPEKVLAPVYENYRRLATENRETKI